jgi:hypothetical protein
VSTDLDDYRRAVLDQLADLPAHELRQARETIDDWLAEREGDDLPSPAACSRELRASLGAGREKAAPHQRFGRWLRSNWLAVTVFGTIAVVSTWWLTLDADVMTIGGGATSRTIPHRTYRATSFDTGSVMFHCQAGDLTVELGLMSDPEVLVKDIRLNTLDSVRTQWSESVRRVGAELEPMPGNPGYVPVKNARVGPSGANVRLRYRFDRCPQPMPGGVAYVQQAEVTYRLYGKTRTERVELLAPIAFTGCQLAETNVKC